MTVDDTRDERQWWDDPALPWRHQPTRADYICMGALGAVAVYGLVMMPLRPVMLGLAPHLLGSLGYRTGLVLVGALAAVGDAWWPLVLLLGSLMAMKFDWIYWWAGRLWGRNVVDVWASGRSERTRRRYERAWTLAHRYETLAIVVTFLPIPLPAGVIYAALGAAGTTLRKFLTVGFLAALTTTAAYLALGYWIGEPAVRLVDLYGRYLWYVSIAILVGMVAVAVWRARRQQPEASGSGEGGAAPEPVGHEGVATVEVVGHEDVATVGPVGHEGVATVEAVGPEDVGGPGATRSA